MTFSFETCYDLRMKAKTLLLDLDGTLVGQRLWVHPTFMFQAFRNIGRILGYWPALRFYSISLRALNSVDGNRTNAERIRAALEQQLRRPKHLIDASIREIEEHLFPKMHRYFHPIPEAQQFVEWAKTRHRLILATNPIWTSGPIRLRVSWAGIDPSIFDWITDSEVMHACKPRIEYYEQILKLQALDPKDCMMIGNDRENDGIASRLGIYTFILGHDGTFQDLRRLLETERS